jgi:hypothetical protein
MAGERHGRGMLCVNPPLGALKLKVIYHIPLEKVLKLSSNFNPNNKEMYS